MAGYTMEKRILSYRKYVDALLLQEDADWERVKSEHLTQISFFQHERLVHLIVTVLFALLTVFAVGMSFLIMAFEREGALGWLLLAAVLMVLLIPYIRHYYILENEVQKMYRQYDAIVGKLGTGFKCE